MGGYRSGQTGQTVNLMPSGFVGSNPTPPKYLNAFGLRRFPHFAGSAAGGESCSVHHIFENNQTAPLFIKLPIFLV